MSSHLPRVTITMNVNNSVEDEESADYDSSKNTESQDAQVAHSGMQH